jgi:hypothetical protein
MENRNRNHNHNHLLSTIRGHRGEINEENKGRRRVNARVTEVVETGEAYQLPISCMLVNLHISMIISAADQPES